MQALVYIFVAAVIMFAAASCALTFMTAWTMWKEDRFRFPEGHQDEERRARDASE